MLGMTVPGFPNFYMLYGPNTNGGEIVFCLERQAEHVVHNVKRMVPSRRDRHRSARGYYEAYNRWIQRKMDGTAWQVSNNYYKAASGRIVTSGRSALSSMACWSKILSPLSETTRLARVVAAPKPGRSMSPDRTAVS